MFLVSELIDTLWNVNPDQISKGLYQRQRINRYIMECKSTCVNYGLQVLYELIDTLWNVNGSERQHTSTGRRELIDTLWNVNVSFTLSTFKSFIELIDTLWNVNTPIYIATN